MIIDCHAHLLAPDALYAYRSALLASGGHFPLEAHIDDPALSESAARNVALLDEVGTDIQLLSPRPYQQMHSAQPPSIVHRWIATNNDLIARTHDLRPTRFFGVAGLPLCAGAPAESCLAELERAVEDLGFVGVSLNPDPGEGVEHTPPMGDQFWYPIYEKVCELDVPILVHSAACRNGRESYSQHFITEESIAILSLAKSRVLDDFPSLRVIIPHGGGSVPYQLGRWEAERLHPGLGGSPTARPFRDSLRQLWFDTVLHNRSALALLFEVVGPERCVFGSERPGSGSTVDPATGRPFDDVRATIEEIDAIDDAARRAIYETNPLAVFPRLADQIGAAA